MSYSKDKSPEHPEDDSQGVGIFHAAAEIIQVDEPNSNTPHNGASVTIRGKSNRWFLKAFVGVFPAGTDATMLDEINPRGNPACVEARNDGQDGDHYLFSKDVNLDDPNLGLPNTGDMIAAAWVLSISAPVTSEFTRNS